MKHGVY